MPLPDRPISRLGDPDSTYSRQEHSASPHSNIKLKAVPAKQVTRSTSLADSIKQEAFAKYTQQAVPRVGDEALESRLGMLGLDASHSLSVPTHMPASATTGRQAAKWNNTRNQNQGKPSESKPPAAKLQAFQPYKPRSANLPCERDLQQEASNDYLRKQRATMTAPHVSQSSWIRKMGKRGQGFGVQRQDGCSSSSMRREPLRLDLCVDD